MLREIQENWNKIRQNRHSSEGISARSLPVSGLEMGDVLLCITQEGNPGILLRCQRSNVVLPKPGAGRLVVKREQLKREGGQPEDYIRIECFEPALEAPFAMLASQVVSHLVSGATPAKACMDAVLEFKRLLSKHGGLLPSEEEILGLAGELLLLKRLSADGSHLWRGWNGPHGAARDYSWGTVDIEAKASRMAGDSRLTVNGLDQLEPDDGRQLLIYHCVLTENPVGTVLIPELIDDLRSMVNDIDGFNERLRCAGYFDEQRELWLEHRFTLNQTSIYRVIDNFPRIRKSDFQDAALPAGVGKLRYDIMLSNCAEFRLSAQEEDELVTSLSKQID